MQIYSVSDKGTLTKVKKANFADNRVFIIDDFKTLYVWFGLKVPESKKALTTRKVNKINDKRVSKKKVDNRIRVSLLINNLIKIIYIWLNY